MSVLTSHPAVQRVELTGSRAKNTQTELSDWDFRIEADPMDRLVADLPDLAAQLDPLMAMWDPLGDVANFMLITQEGVKIDLFPANHTRPHQPPWDPSKDDPRDIDGHFWDWTLWLAGKHLKGKPDLVTDELRKMHRHLLGPLGAPTPPTTIEEAVAAYQHHRDAAVESTLEQRILPRLRAANVL